MWVGSATCSTLPVARQVRPPPTWFTRGKSRERTYCFNFKALCSVSEEASFGLQFHTQMSQQPVAAGEDASSVAKRVHLFIPGHSERTGYGVLFHLPVTMPVLMEAAYSGNKEAAPAPPPSLHHVPF